MARQAKVLNRRLSIYLMKTHVKEFADAIDVGQQHEQAELDQDLGIDGVLYYETRPPKPASWVEFVQPALTTELTGLFSASSSGLLLLRSSERMFAIVFGFGKALLDMEAVERRFGLRVTLNRVPSGALRSLDTKVLDDMIVSKRTQTSRKADLPAFGVDVSRDLLRSATGKPDDSTFATSLSGSDVLVISCPVEIDQLPQKCTEILQAYQETRYQAEFGWVDHLMPVTSRQQVDELDDKLVDALKSGGVASVHLAPPEPLPWDEVGGFRFKVSGSRGKVYDDLDLEEYLESLDDISTLTPALLRSRRVQVQWGRTGDFDDRWSVYRCLVAEYRIDDSLYVLTEGEWFQVADSLVGRLDNFLATLGSSDFSFPAATKGAAESAYNQLLAPPGSPDAVLLDMKLPRPGSAASGIEPCDVLTRDGEFIHVKRKARSSTLSHLFSQGSTSLAALQQDEIYREKVRKAIVERADGRDPSEWLAHVPVDWPAGFAANLKVTYVVVANGSDEGYGWLPFFSKLNLMQHSRLIGLVGAKVSLVRVPVS